jgi:PAS domain S-box-containing protein
MHSLNNHEQLLLAQQTLEKAQEAIVWTDMEGRLLYTNPKTCDLLGYSNEELLQKSVSDLDPDYSPEAIREICEKIKTEGAFSLETRIHHKNGAFIPVDIVINYIKFNHNEFASAFIRDISRRKKSKPSLRIPAKNLVF